VIKFISVFLRTCSLGTYTQVGPRSRIQDDAVLDRAVVGSDCIIGHRAVIRNSTIWDGAHIGDGSIITDSIVGNGVRIGPNSRVQRGSLIGENTVLGSDAALPIFSRVAACPPLDEDWDDEENGKETGYKWRLTDRMWHLSEFRASLLIE
jgi:translation initiation factor eIF-2B subunit epsilon